MSSKASLVTVVTEAEHAAVKDAADSLGMSVSAYIRGALIIAAHALSFMEDDDDVSDYHNEALWEEVERMKNQKLVEPRREIPALHTDEASVANG